MLDGIAKFAHPPYLYGLCRYLSRDNTVTCRPMFNHCSWCKQRGHWYILLLFYITNGWCYLMHVLIARNQSTGMLKSLAR